MARVNLTLEPDTLERLERHAREVGKARTTLARELLIEGLDRVERRRRARKLAADYAAGADEARRLLGELEGAQVRWED